MEEQTAASLILLQSDIDTSSVDLSTPRGAITHFRDLMLTGMDEHSYGGKLLSLLYDYLLNNLDSGRYSPDQVEELHRVAKEICEVAHRFLEYRKLYQVQDERLNMWAMRLRDAMLKSILVMSLVTYDFLNTKQTKAILYVKGVRDVDEKRPNDDYDTVD